MKVCKKCKSELPLDQFYVTTGGNVLTKCNGCRLQEKREYNARTKKHRAEYTASIPIERRKARYLKGREKDRQRKEQKLGTVFGWCGKLFHAAKARAKKKGMDFSISYDFVLDLWERQNGSCCLTGIPFELRTGGNCGYKRFNPYSASLDRIDNGKGYTADNVRLVCTAINLAINEFGLEQFEKLCKNFVNYRGK